MCKPAARVGDLTTHGSPLTPIPGTPPPGGSPDVIIGNQHAWRAIIDQHICAALPDGTGNVLMGNPTILINNQMACEQGDIVIEKPGAALGPVNPILLGCFTVLFGMSGSSSQAATMSAAKAAAAPFTKTKCNLK